MRVFIILLTSVVHKCLNGLKVVSSEQARSDGTRQNSNLFSVSFRKDIANIIHSLERKRYHGKALFFTDVL